MLAVVVGGRSGLASEEDGGVGLYETVAIELDRVRGCWGRSEAGRR